MFERTTRLIFILLLFWLPSAFAEVAITSTRIWPAQDYTRVTIESDAPLSQRHFMAENPGRLVIDIDGLELSPALRDLVAAHPALGADAAALVAPGVSVRRRITPGGAGPVPVATQIERFRARLAELGAAVTADVR